jgi:hypothetical protein
MGRRDPAYAYAYACMQLLMGAPALLGCCAACCHQRSKTWWTFETWEAASEQVARPDWTLLAQPAT